MSDRDPAVEAAQRAWTGFAGGMFTRSDPEYLGLLAAAREALAPLKGLHQQWLANAEHYKQNAETARSIETETTQRRLQKLCQRMADELASLIYPEEELS